MLLIYFEWFYREKINGLTPKVLAIVNIKIREWSKSRFMSRDKKEDRNVKCFHVCQTLKWDSLKIDTWRSDPAKWEFQKGFNNVTCFLMPVSHFKSLFIITFHQIFLYTIPTFNEVKFLSTLTMTLSPQFCCFLNLTTHQKQRRESHHMGLWGSAENDLLLN